MGENDNNDVGILTDEQADSALDIPQVEFKDGEETMQLPASTVKKLIETSKSALAQKKHWRGKAIDPDSGKPYKELVPKRENNNNGQQTVSGNEALERQVGALTLAEEKRQFGHANKLSPEETDSVFSFAAGQQKKPSEVLTHPFIKSGIEAMRRDARTSGGIPGPSGRSPVVEGKHWGEMDHGSREKNFGAVVRNITGKNQ